MTTELKPTVFEAWGRVMENVQSIAKDDHNRAQNFKFRGIDAVVNAVGPVLRKENVIVVPEEAGFAEERFETKSGAKMRGVTVSVTFRVYGPDGSSFTGKALGEAADSGDKAIPKAHSVAYRTFLLQSLCIPTGDPDPDSESYERGGESKQDERSIREIAEEFAASAGMDFWDVFEDLGLALESDRDSLTRFQASQVCKEISDRKKAK